MTAALAAVSPGAHTASMLIRHYDHLLMTSAHFSGQFSGHGAGDSAGYSAAQLPAHAPSQHDGPERGQQCGEENSQERGKEHDKQQQSQHHSQLALPKEIAHWRDSLAQALAASKATSQGSSGRDGSSGHDSSSASKSASSCNSSSTSGNSADANAKGSSRPNSSSSASGYITVPTSGSTGQPRQVLLSAAALRASARATQEVLGGPGRWLLTLPARHIAGTQVIVRSLLAQEQGVTDALIASQPGVPFTAVTLLDLLRQAFAASAPPAAGGHGRLPGAAPPVYISLVPTQLHRIMVVSMAGDASGQAAVEALARCQAVLLGGAGAQASLLDWARASGITVVTTYGMSETSGGCIYNGRPLPGVTVCLVRPDGEGLTECLASWEQTSPEQGLIAVAGPMLAQGYLDAAGQLDRAASDASFVTDAHGIRWHVTRDIGSFDSAGRLVVQGRADHAIISGGVNVFPDPLEKALTDTWWGLYGQRVQVCVVGVPDSEWGQRVTAVVATGSAESQALPDEHVRNICTKMEGALRTVGISRTHMPRDIYVTDVLPEIGPGKVDRAAVTTYASAQADKLRRNSRSMGTIKEHNGQLPAVDPRGAP